MLKDLRFGILGVFLSVIIIILTDPKYSKIKKEPAPCFKTKNAPQILDSDLIYSCVRTPSGDITVFGEMLQGEGVEHLRERGATMCSFFIEDFKRHAE